MKQQVGTVPDRLIMEVDDEVRIVSTQCTECGGATFPAQDSCARCGSESVVDTPLPRTGEIWSYTVQTFRPPSPPFAPGEEGEVFPAYGVAMVAFEGGLCIQGRLTISDPAEIHIGMPVETVLVPLEGAGDNQSIYAFRPVKGEIDQ